MKKLIILLFSLIILSCMPRNEITFLDEDIKYIIMNSTNVSMGIRENLNSKNTIVLFYPAFYKESYDLIAFVTSILKDYRLSGVYHPKMEHFDLSNDHKDEILKTEPMYSFDSFYYLLDYYKKNEVDFISYNSDKEGTKLILIPEGYAFDFKAILNYIDNLEEEDVKKIVLQGTTDTVFLNSFIPLLPQGKKISFIPLYNWRFAELKEKYHALVFLGEIDEYTKGNAVVLFSEDNYLDAPQDFFEKNKGLFKTRTISKMNNALPKTINKDWEKRIR